MLDHLKEQNETISVEAAGGPTLISSAISRLPKFLADAKAFFMENTGIPLLNLIPRKTISAFSHRIQPVPYTDLRETIVVVPPGLKVDLETYSTKLAKAAEYASTFRAEVLDPFHRWLSGKISDPSSLASMRPALEIEGYKKRPYEAQMSALANCFDDKSEVGEVPYGKALRRNADWAEIVSNAQKIQEIFLKDDQHLTQREIVQTSDLMDLLLKRLNESPEEYQLSKATLTSLADATLALAREIEFYGMVRYRLLEFDHAIKETIARLNAAATKLGR